MTTTTDEYKQAHQTAQVAHEAAIATTNTVMRKVRRDMSSENVHDLMDAIEDERAAAEELQRASSSSIVGPLLNMMLEANTDEGT